MRFEETGVGDCGKGEMCLEMDKKSLISDIQDYVQSFEDDEVFDELRGWAEDIIKDKKLKDALIDLIDQSESDYEDSEMILAVLESEIDAYFSKSKEYKNA